MPHGYTSKEWEGVPAQERAGWFAEEVLEFAAPFLENPVIKGHVDLLIDLTTRLYTNRYSPDEIITAEAGIEGARFFLLSNPDREVGRIAFECGWIGAYCFKREILSTSKS
ncbi:hypothetical protein HYS91_05255 [Candidatus Daviesbacteria bacterium]|nr:hypothetical protein [Candidatus Daviesbacteria bacterium]